MKTIELKNLTIENFKGCREMTINFSSKTNIYGENGSGKTTIVDAVNWLLFDKDSLGNTKFDIRPKDTNGSRVDNVEIKVVGIFDVEGYEIKLQKIQKQKWVKKRGTDVTELQGNINEYEVNDIPKTEKDYKAYISEIVDEDLFKLVTNPKAFVSLNWKKQREILLDIVSDITDSDVLASNKKLSELEADLGMFTVDELTAKAKKAMAEYKKRQAELPARIDELSKQLVYIDVAEQGLAKSDLERMIVEIDTKIADVGSAVSDLRSEDMKLQFSISGIMQEMNRALYEKQRNVGSQLENCIFDINDLQNHISTKERQIANNKLAIEAAEKRRSELGAQYNEEKSKVFDETPYLFHEEEWQFDENSTICKSCGQVLPADKIEQIKADFEARKEKAKEESFRKLADAKNKFVELTNSNLENIKSKGFEQKHIIDDLTAKNEQLQAEIESLKKREQDAIAKKNELSKQLDELPAEADYSQNEEYVKLKSRHDEIISKIDSMKSVEYAVDKFKKEREFLVLELDSVKAEIAKSLKNSEIEERIGELQSEQREVGQKVADQEKKLYLLEQFTREKMNILSEKINSKFSIVTFKLFEEQINGGMRETCECVVNGVPYSSLNSAAKIQAGLDIIRTMSELYSISAPVFIDNRESVTDIPDMQCQVVSLYVSESDKKIRVESNEL